MKANETTIIGASFGGALTLLVAKEFDLTRTIAVSPLLGIGEYEVTVILFSALATVCLMTLPRKRDTSL